MTIREEASRVIGESIPKDRWDEAFIELNRYGRLDINVILGLLLIILKRLDKEEQNATQVPTTL